MTDDAIWEEAETAEGERRKVPVGFRAKSDRAEREERFNELRQKPPDAWTPKDHEDFQYLMLWIEWDAINE